jgi:hypothetical protein
MHTYIIAYLLNNEHRHIECYDETPRAALSQFREAAKRCNTPVQFEAIVDAHSKLIMTLITG